MRNAAQSASLDQSSDASAALLSAIVESSHDAIVSKTLEGIITSWNPAAEEMFGYTAAEAVGRSIRMIIPPERIAEEDFVLGQIRRGEKVDHFETIRQTRDGRRLNISLTVSPIRDSNENIVGASKIARDITESKRLEKEREQLLISEREARGQLTQAIRARDEFVAVAAHELRNPLNVFMLNLQLMHRIIGNPAGFDQMRGLVEKSRRQLDRISALIDRLLDVTRMRAATLALNRAPTSLDAVLNDIQQRLRNQKPPVSISMKVQDSIEGNWDRVRIDQAITNLISNAIKYAEQPVEVLARLDDGQAVISISDHGPGIPPGELERIFDRFERDGGDRLDGFGLGLWITRQIVQAHGGTTIAQSRVGEGSRFEIRLPIPRLTD